MIELEGRMLAGLDEFMLRLGHLKVLCRVAADVGVSWPRINRETVKVLTNPIVIPSELVGSVCEYLRRKRLCPIVTANDAAHEKKDGAKYRYADISVKMSGEKLQMISETAEPKIWWQDLCLAGPRVVSRVGAITVSGKSGSKTGLSHICDWAQFVGVISRAGELSAIGRLIVHLKVGATCSGAEANPYVIGFERLALAFTILEADIDCFSRLARNLLEAEVPIRKSEGTRIFGCTVRELAEEARHARYLSAGRKGRLYANMRDLENAARRSGRELESTSTAWHRASSRLETYVDLGLLEKGRGGEGERFEYVYYPTKRLTYAASSLADETKARDWLEKHLAATLFEIDPAQSSADRESVLKDLPVIAGLLARPTGPLPITALAIASAWLHAERGVCLSILEARTILERLARDKPDLARLSRGAHGDRAEFISLDLRRLEETIA